VHPISKYPGYAYALLQGNFQKSGRLCFSVAGWRTAYVLKPWISELLRAACRDKPLTFYFRRPLLFHETFYSEAFAKQFALWCAKTRMFSWFT